MSNKFNEKQPRSISKVVSWRIIMTISHVINGLLVSGSIAIAAQIAGMAAIINSVLFWIHERVWNRIEWKREQNQKIKFNEKQPRTISKVVSWRIIITISNFAIPFFTTGDYTKALAFMTIATFVNMGLYWVHERVWNRVIWGKTVEE